MATQQDRDEGERVASVPPDRALEAFVDAAPRTAADVAAAAGVGEEAAREALSTLRDRGELERRTVSGVDVTAQKAAEEAGIDVDEPIELWYLPAERLAEGPAERPDAEDEVGRRLERMDVPGASGMMRNWRRDAVRAAYGYLRSSGGATPDELCEDVYPGHEAGFDDAGDWWAFLRPRLYRLPGVAVDDDVWFVQQRPVRPRRR